MKIIKRLIKNMIVSFFSIYSINLVTTHIDFLIPINYFSILFTTFLGMPGLIVYALLLFKFL